MNEQREAYQKTSGAILPDGLAVINTSYRNEAGETERIVERVDADEQVRQTLESTRLNDVKLKDWYDRLVDAGRRIGPLATRLGVTGVRAEEVVLEFKARQSWTNMVNTLRRSAFLVEWTEEHLDAIFGQVDRISAQRSAAQRAKPSPEAPAGDAGAADAPEPSSPPAVTDPVEPS
jgi:hypothetical protein